MVTCVQGEENVNESIGSGYWCANCHWDDATNYSGTSYSPAPPEITNTSLTSTDGTAFVDHTGYDMTDAGCKACHGGLLVGNYMTEFMHNVFQG